jgi:glycine/D-amino acid oxidase-like deaminating enzyme
VSGWRRVGILPGDDAGNGWLAPLPARAPRPPLAGEQRADWLVIGAGFAGLAAARRLAENRPRERVLLLEAQRVGDGASGRNSGFALDLPLGPAGKAFDAAATQDHIALSRAAIAHLAEQVRRHAIACDWTPRGRWYAARDPRVVEQDLETYAREMAAVGEPLRWAEADELKRRLGTAFFSRALWQPGGALMNPAALVRGLADSLPGNVTLCEGTPVTALAWDNGIVATTPGGGARAPRMILAVNGFAREFGFYRRRLVLTAISASVTRPLTAAEQRLLGEDDDWGVLPARGLAGATLRYTRDRRIVHRHRITFNASFRQSPAEIARVERAHRAGFLRRFPQLAEVPFTHTWTGHVALARNQAPGFGLIAPGVYAAVCQNGPGVTNGTIAGLLAADLACGEDNPLIALMQRRGTPSRTPPRPFYDLGVKARWLKEMWRGRSER